MSEFAFIFISRLIVYNTVYIVNRLLQNYLEIFSHLLLITSLLQVKRCSMDLVESGQQSATDSVETSSGRLIIVIDI
jgi:hypothetical protein